MHFKTSSKQYLFHHLLFLCVNVISLRRNATKFSVKLCRMLTDSSNPESFSIVAMLLNTDAQTSFTCNIYSGDVIHKINNEEASKMTLEQLQK